MVRLFLCLQIVPFHPLSVPLLCVPLLWEQDRVEQSVELLASAAACWSDCSVQSLSITGPDCLRSSLSPSSGSGASFSLRQDAAGFLFGFTTQHRGKHIHIQVWSPCVKPQTVVPAFSVVVGSDGTFVDTPVLWFPRPFNPGGLYVCNKRFQPSCGRGCVTVECVFYLIGREIG